MFSKIYLYKSYPASWSFPGDIDNGNYKVSDVFLNADFLSFKLWLDEIGLNDKLLYTARVDYKYLSDGYFPNYVYWESDGYRVEVYLDYP